LSKKTKSKKVLIVGAGPVGCTVAENLSRKSYEVDIIDSRNHIAGNCFDYKDKYGVLIHKYGPHYFRTNNKLIFEYLSKFTKWIPGKYVVNSYVDGKYFDFPINLNTINKFFGKNFKPTQAKKFLKKISVKKIKKNNFQNYLLSKIGKKLFDKFYKNYSLKQWGINTNRINTSVAKRIPIRFNNNKNYISAKYKFMPKYGFTSMFKKMISSKNINLYLNKKYKYSSKHLKKYDLIIYTGPIDSFFNYKFGELGWRSLKFNFTTYNQKFKQHCLQINFPNDFKYTRKVEYKHVTGQKSNYTTISKEFPTSYGDPYYPMSTKADKKILLLYNNLKKEYEKKGIYFGGRLADYKYINTDEAIGIGLNISNKILKKHDR